MKSFKTLRIIASSVSFVLAVSGCGKDHNTGLEANTMMGVPNGPRDKTGVDRHPLTGTWKSNCIAKDQDSRKVEVRIFDDRTLLLQLFYLDRQCQQLHLQSVVYLKSLPTQTRRSQEWSLDGSASQVKDALMSPGSDQAVTTMNQSRSCGKADWSKNHMKTVYGTDCYQREVDLGRIRLSVTDQSQLRVFFASDELGILLFERI